MNFAEILKHDPVSFAFPESVRMSDEQFYEFCLLNRDWQFERNSDGELVIMAPRDWRTDESNAHVITQLISWAKRDRTGRATGSSAGFVLPDRSVRSPDAAWIRKERIDTLGALDEGFLPLCPDFVVEIRSPTDRLSRLQAKMQQYIENGVRLGWLIDSKARRVYVYRPGALAQTLEGPTAISGDPELPGFSLDTKDIWDLDQL